MKRLLLFVLLIGTSCYYTTAENQYFFYVQLTNKHNNPYSLSQPLEFLSLRAIERRASFGIACDSTDLPVNPNYVAAVSAIGVKVHSQSKWLNGLTIRMADSSLMAQVRALPFVKRATFSGIMNSEALPAPRKAKFGNETLGYGTTATQINQLNGSALHEAGFTGRGMQVAVLDAGFKNANTNVGFDSLRLQGRLLGTKDFAEPNSNIYNLDAHGANVLSIMTGNLPGQYLGSAPHASYWLIRTEYAPSEYLMELDFWVSGIEFADSVGVDITNTSLGYTTFDDVSMNFTYADMNGKTSRMSQAAEMAVKKGIVMCNSAGNDGNKAWKYISAPADADGIFTIGAADSSGNPSSFTSFGPTADFRIKPEISAMGTSTAIINSSGLTAYGNGTSYSSPLMCGMLTCLLQYYKTNKQDPNLEDFRKIVLENSHLHNAPSDRLGYGFPNFQQIMQKLAAGYITQKESLHEANIQFLANKKLIQIHLPAILKNNINLRIFDISGKIQFQNSYSEQKIEISTEQFSSGLYLISIDNGMELQTEKIIIQN